MLCCADARHSGQVAAALQKCAQELLKRSIVADVELCCRGLTLLAAGHRRCVRVELRQKQAAAATAMRPDVGMQGLVR